MSDYRAYVPATKGRRFGAFFVNLFLLGLVSAAFDSFGDVETKRLATPLTLALVLAFCVFPESPGKRLFNLKILDEQMAPIGALKRLFRCLPYLLLWSVLWIPDFFSLASKGSKVVFSLSFMLVVLFLLANSLAMLFSPDGRSLLDMRLCTRVFTPAPIPGLERPKLFGIRIW